MGTTVLEINLSIQERGVMLSLHATELRAKPVSNGWAGYAEQKVNVIKIMPIDGKDLCESGDCISTSHHTCINCRCI